MTPRRAVVLALAGLLVLACGSDGPSPRRSDSPAPSATPRSTAPIPWATGPTDLVLRQSTGGGLVPPSVQLADIPDVSIYGDGRVVRLGAHGDTPGEPLLPELLESRLTPEGMRTVLWAARDAGLLGPDRRYELPGVYDLWTAVFIVTADGRTHRISAYALGFNDEARLAPPSEMEARRTLEAFFERLVDLRGWLGTAVTDETRYQPIGTRVFIAPVVAPGPGGTASPVPVTPAPGQDVRAWPLDGPPGLFGTPLGEHRLGWRCAVVDPTGLAKLGIDTATHGTRWQAGDRLYEIVARPLLPEESGCPTLD